MTHRDNFIPFFQYVDYIESNDRMINEWWNGKDLEWSGLGLIEVPFMRLSGGTDEDHEKPQSL
jgi:hypothetical protein